MYVGTESVMISFHQQHISDLNLYSICYHLNYSNRALIIQYN